MDKTLQTTAWSCLPKEFKEEVKSIFTEYSNTKFSAVRSELMNIFGLDNLTSDAEGEEMLTVSRKIVQDLYAKFTVQKENNFLRGYFADSDLYDMKIELLYDLFGDKCSSYEKSTYVENNVDNLEQKSETENKT